LRPSMGDRSMSRWQVPGRAVAIGAAALGLTAATARPIVAHEGAPPAPHDIWTAWTVEPLALVALVATGYLYARGSGRSRAGHAPPLGRRLAFWCGLAALAAALFSPVAALGLAIFAGHMVQHLILVLVAAPLIVLGRPLTVLARGLSHTVRRLVARRWPRGLIRAFRHGAGLPLLIWWLHVGALWIWHLPAWYQAALRDEAVHALEHLTFAGTAILFWWAVLPAGRRFRLSPGAGGLYLFAAAMQGTALGALMTFAARPWYPDYAPSAPAWGLTPVEDQQLAGLVMWIPAAVVYVIAAAGLIVVWLDADGAQAAPGGGRPPVSPDVPPDAAGLPARNSR
ncbi:MAG TPA: cytochrome c oxidase assembly protein, partial [Dehalococcoidia bacterium]|nr:cytochrome c oxidase assembly protein [Dehalococcoidia bacterium]